MTEYAVSASKENGVMQLIRFKVIRASRLLIGMAIALLVIVFAVLILRLVLSDRGAPASIQQGNSSIVRMNEPIEAVAAFAAASSLHEDEHTDESVPMIIEVIPYDTPSPADEPLFAEPKETNAPTAQNAAKKRVLIYHTHTHEAYEQEPSDPYVALEPWRTADRNHSIVRVGDELAQLLRAEGIEVVHDVTDHEPPKLGTAYVRSLLTLEKYADTPFDCYIDLHRDAHIEGQAQSRVTLSGSGAQSAQLMMLIGNGEGFDVKPYYTENIAFARQITLALNQIQSGLCKDVLVKTGRYNQHIGKRAILVEVGDNKNTLTEALNAMPALSEALCEVLNGQVFLPKSTPEAVQASSVG